MTPQKLLDLLSKDTPCDKCKYSKLCATQHKACEKMFLFVEKGEINNNITPHPTYDWYDEIYGEGHSENPFYIIGSKTLYDVHARHGWKEKASLVRHQIQSTYEASTMKKFNKQVLDDFDDLGVKMYWAVTDKPYVVLGGIGLVTRPNSTEVVYLYVRDHYKNIGVGTQLMEYAETTSDYILVSPEGVAEGFYRNRGYQEKSGTREMHQAVGLEGVIYYKEIPKES